MSVSQSVSQSVSRSLLVYNKSSVTVSLQYNVKLNYDLIGLNILFTHNPFLVAEGIQLSGGHVVANISPPFTITIGGMTNSFANRQASPPPQTSPPQHLMTPLLCTGADDVVDGDHDNGEIGGTHVKKMNFQIGKQLLLLNMC